MAAGDHLRACFTLQQWQVGFTAAAHSQQMQICTECACNLRRPARCKETSAMHACMHQPPGLSASPLQPKLPPPRPRPRAARGRDGGALPLPQRVRLGDGRRILRCLLRLRRLHLLLHGRPRIPLLRASDFRERKGRALSAEPCLALAGCAPGRRRWQATLQMHCRPRRAAQTGPTTQDPRHIHSHMWTPAMALLCPWHPRVPAHPPFAAAPGARCGSP